MNYDAMRDMAVRLLRTNGRQLTFRRTTPAALDPATGRIGAPVIVTAVAYSVVLPYRVVQVNGNKMADKLLVREGEQLVLIAGAQMTVTGAPTWEPLAGDQLTTALPGPAGAWKVARSITFDPDGTGSILHAAVLTQ